MLLPLLGPGRVCTETKNCGKFPKQEQSQPRPTLTQKVVLDQDERSKSAELTLISMGVGTMSSKTVQKTVSESCLERLLRQGHIRRVPAVELGSIPGIQSSAVKAAAHTRSNQGRSTHAIRPKSVIANRRAASSRVRTQMDNCGESPARFPNPHALLAGKFQA